MALFSTAILYGPIASLPTDNSALTVGRLYFASDTGAALRDNGTSWDPVAAAGSPGTFFDEAVTMSGTSGAFAHTPVHLIGLFKNGQRLTALGSAPDFSNVGTAITLTVAAVSGDFYEAIYWY